MTSTLSFRSIAKGRFYKWASPSEPIAPVLRSTGLNRRGGSTITERRVAPPLTHPTPQRRRDIDECQSTSTSTRPRPDPLERGRVASRLADLCAWERVAWLGRSIEDRLRYVCADAPRMLYQSAFWAFAATVVAWLWVRFVVGPLARRWIAPPMPQGEAMPRGFLLEPKEIVLFERPSRVLIEGIRRPGALVLTDRRIRFFPRDAAVPSWSIDREAVVEIGFSPVPARFAAIVSGLPDRLAIVDRSSKTVLATLLDSAEFADRFRLNEMK